jgi:hypothetical protein
MQTPFLRVGPLVCLAAVGGLATACGDDASSGTPGSEGGAGGTAGAGTNAPGGHAMMGDAGGGDGPLAGAAGSGGAPAACGEADFATLEGGSWDDRFSIAGVTGPDGITPLVADFALEPDGSVLAVGRFAYHEGKAVTPLIRRSQGRWQAVHETWSIEPPGDGFAAIALDAAGKMALATGDSFGERDGEIWIDADDEQVVIASFTGQVRSLAWFGGELYAAGAFQLDAAAGGVANLAVWDGSHWSEPSGGPAGGPVLELLVSADALYVGGAFTEIGGISSANVASFDGADWTPLPLADALAVYALARTDEGELYAGGVLGELGAASGLVKRVGSEWEVVGGGLAQFQTRGVVSDLIAHDGVIDVAGCFSSAGGFAEDPGSVPSVGLARWSGEQWQSLNDGRGAASPWFQPTVCGDEGVGALWDMEYQRLAFSDGALLAGGSFAGIDGVQTQSLALREQESWEAQGESGLGLGGSLDRVVTGGPDCDLYGLGAFTHLGGEPSPGRVAHFSGGSWRVLSDQLPSDAYCPALDVSATGKLAVGCTVFPALGAARGAVLQPSGDELVELELSAELPPIQALKWDENGRLWVAGGDATGFVATIEAGSVTVVSEDFDGPVQLLDLRGDNDVLAAGMFTSVGDVSAERIARYTAGEWSALGDGLIGQPLAIARDEANVYVSTYDDGQGAFLLGAFDGKEWQELAGESTGLVVESFYSFNQILPVGGGLVLVGTAELSDKSGRGALLYRDGQFLPVGGGGVHAIGVSGVSVGRDELWIGGIIAEASNGDELTSSVGVARLSW